MFFNSTVAPFSFKEQQDPKDPSRFEEQRQESALRREMRSSQAQQTLKVKMRRRRRRCEVFILKNKTKQNKTKQNKTKERKREKKRGDEEKVIENE